MSNDSFSAELITSTKAISHFKNSTDGTLYHNPEFINTVLGEIPWIGGFKKENPTIP